MVVDQVLRIQDNNFFNIGLKIPDLKASGTMHVASAQFRATVGALGHVLDERVAVGLISKQFLKYVSVKYAAKIP